MDEKIPGMNNDSQPLVSIIMSVFNGEQFLQQAIDSILSQTYSHWEFIIIDDACNAATKSILKRYDNDGRFKIITNTTNQGLTKNLNMAIDFCEGEFIARMDGDDISLSERLNEQVNFLLKHQRTAAVFGFVDLVDEMGTFIGYWPDDRKASTYDKIKHRLPFSNCVAHPTVMIRKNVLQQYKYNENQAYSQDWDLWLRLVSDGIIIEKINKPVLLYRIHKNSVTKISNKRSAFLKIHKSYIRYLKKVWKDKKINGYNLLIHTGFILNLVKLGLSKIKRTFIANKS